MWRKEIKGLRHLVAQGVGGWRVSSSRRLKSREAMIIGSVVRLLFLTGGQSEGDPVSGGAFWVVRAKDDLR